MRDLKKLSAYDSGMRGSEKPRVTESSKESGGESKQGAGTKVGSPDGDGLAAFSSGMRGGEQPRKKGADGANADQQTDQAGELGAGGNLEDASQQAAPEAHEDDTHINVRIPKSSIRRKGPRA
ncbi:MAG TPA: hypothetical protein VKU44_06840 [Terriglobia bacterium]|nr:hypothetical protein [Terriglobia bacterium]